MTGVAFSQRKLGHYAEAEATYQEVLSRATTADSHFLLAQFYDDTQQTRKAREHARRAMTLAPQRYQQEGEKLIRKLTVYHFGCFHVFSAGKD
jgi:tetratricopeptide (TPR) repeat protein